MFDTRWLEVWLLNRQGFVGWKRQYPDAEGDVNARVTEFGS